MGNGFFIVLAGRVSGLGKLAQLTSLVLSRPFLKHTSKTTIIRQNFVFFEMATNQVNFLPATLVQREKPEKFTSIDFKR